MLTILQVLTLAAGFLLPWSIGGIVSFSKQGNIRSRNLCILGLLACAAIIAVTAAITAMIA